jgi:phage/plasmid-associated DNA primase
MLTSSINLQKALVLYGPGGNGKTAAAEVMMHILGQLKCQVALQNLGDRFNKILFYQKLGNIYDDLSHTDLLEDGFFKQLTGSGEVEAEFKNSNARLKYRNTCKLLFTCNQLPSPRFDISTAFFDRWIIIPFLQRIRGTHMQDIDLGKKLDSELPYICMYLLSFLSRKKELLKINQLETAKTWMMYSNSVLSFMETVDRSPDGAVQCTDFYKVYIKYCGEKNLISKSFKAFGSILQDMGISRIQKEICTYKTIQWCYIGVDI